MQPGYARIQAICDWVHDRTEFKVGTSNPSTTALDTYEHRSGVCRDFAHLTITLCRALNVPARFVSALDYGADPALGPPDFHAYAECFLGGRWYVFDSTRISPRTGLLRLGTGRDAADVAFATIFGPVQTTMPRVCIRAVDDPRRDLPARGQRPRRFDRRSGRVLARRLSQRFAGRRSRRRLRFTRRCAGARPLSITAAAERPSILCVVGTSQNGCHRQALCQNDHHWRVASSARSTLLRQSCKPIALIDS